MSDSPPFLTPSVELATPHTPAVHTSKPQSPFTAHTLPTPHLGALGPPQSTSVSPLFFLPSVASAGVQ